MAAASVPCHVLGGEVTIVTSLDGATKVICPELNRFSHKCNRKTANDGLLMRVAEMVADRVSGTRLAYCEFLDPKDTLFAPPSNPTPRVKA